MKKTHEAREPRVMVIDDEAVACRQIKRALEKDNCLVEVFHDGESALKRLTSLPFELVICDLMLPGINGLQVLKNTKKYHQIGRAHV